MESSFDLKAIARKVFSLLTDVPETRDNDKLLLVEIWRKESKSLSAHGFFDELFQGLISFPDTITRVRRKLQEKYPSLRGEKWELRHRLEGAMCEQLTFFDSEGI